MIKCNVGDIFHFKDKNSNWWEFIAKVTELNEKYFTVEIIKYIKSGVNDPNIIEEFAYNIDSRHNITYLGTNLELVNILYG